MRKIGLGLIIILLFAVFSEIATMQQVSATSEFSGYVTLIIKQKSDGAVLVSSSPQWFETDPIWVWVAVVAIVAFTAVAIVAICKKDVNEGQGYIQADLKVTKANGVKVETSAKAGSETIIAEVPITSMSEEGEWTFELTGIPYKTGEGGGIVIPVDKFGLLAPYIGLASTIVVATVATAIYVKRVKRRKDKQ